MCEKLNMTGVSVATYAHIVKEAELIGWRRDPYPGYIAATALESHRFEITASW
jgi:hypothetical protein